MLCAQMHAIQCWLSIDVNFLFCFMQFNGAFDMLKESEKMNLTPTSSMYNAIMAGYFREVL